MDSGKNNVSSDWCVFCWNSLSGNTTERNSVALQKHLTLIERYFQNLDKSDKTLRIAGIEINRSALFGSCESGSEIVKEFSKLYHEMKCIKLKLNWKLDSLKTIVEKAEIKKLSKIKSVSLKKAGHGAKLEKRMEELLEFRSNFVHKCSLHFKQSYPKLTLKRHHDGHEQEAANVPLLDSHHLIPTDEISNGITDENDSCDEFGKGENIEEVQLKSPIQQRKRRSLNSVSKAKLNKRASEFRIPELETLEMANDSAPSIVLYGTNSGLELNKAMKTKKSVTFQLDTPAVTSNTSNSETENESCTNVELAGSFSRHQVNIPSIVESIIKNIMSEETETTTIPAFQGDYAASSATTFDYVSTSSLKFEDQPILFDDEENDATDPLNDDNIESENAAGNGILSTAHCDKEISTSETFLVKRELDNPITAPLKETTSSSRTPVKVPLKFSALVSNEVLKKMDTVTENTKINSDESPSAQMPENESVSRFRRRFKCSQCTLTFTSEGSLESHLTSAHVQLEDINDKDHVDGKFESQLEIDDVDDYAFSFKEGGEHGDSLGSESDSNFDINEEGRQSEADDEFEEKPLQSELQSAGSDETDIEASKSLKKKSSRRKKGDSVSVRDLKCEKCEPWSRESDIPWYVHLAKHRYLHTNGQEPLGDKNPEHLNIKWSDLKVEIDGHVAELKEEYTAPGCGRKFALEEDLVYHLRLHGNYKCAKSTCKTRKICLMDLIEHELNHGATHAAAGYGPTKCTRCEFKANGSRKIFLHFIKAHSYEMIDSKSFEKYHCRICNFSFDIISGCFPMRHFLNFHDLSRIDDPSKVRRCKVPDCPAYFLTVRQLKAHHHKQNPRSNTTKAPSTTNKRRLRPNQLMLANMRKAKITEEGLTLEDFVSRKGAEFKCDEASCNNAAFFTEEELNIHRKLHGDFKCNFCETVENHAPDLCRHELEVHSGTADDSDTNDAKVVECPRCPKKSRGRLRYIVHHLGKHLGLERDTPRCLICGVLYLAENKALEERIFTHFKEHHDLSTLETTGDDAVWRCKKENCKAYFLSRLQLSNHVQDMHCVKSLVRKMPCLECDKTYKTQVAFSKHMLKFHSEEYHKFFPFPCEIVGCIRRCETEISLRKHLRASHPKQSNQHLCPVCGKYFNQLWSLKAHMQSHDEEHQKGVEETKRKYQCDQCGIAWKDKTALDIHKLSHSGQESWTFICEVCSRKCLTKQKLEEHLRTHTKEKPFKCDHCGASYAHRHNWRIHVQKQHGLDVTRVYKKVNERMKAKYVKKVGDADGQGTSASQRKRKAPKRKRKDREEEEESLAIDSDFTD